MKGLLLFLVICFLVVNQSLAEVWPAFPIPYLAMKCDDILLAKPVAGSVRASDLCIRDEKSNSWVLVEIVKVYRSAEYCVGDTVWVCLFDLYSFLNEEDPIFDKAYLSASDTISQMWLFGEMKKSFLDKHAMAPCKGKYFHTEFSGVRFQDQIGSIYSPSQINIPGNFYFSNSSQSIENFDKLVTESVDLTNRLFAIRRITNKRIQNDSLFSWIELVKAKPIENGFARQDAWGQNVQVPFAWIIGNGEDDQAWKAIMLHTEMFQVDKLWCNYRFLYFHPIPEMLGTKQNAFEKTQRYVEPFKTQSGIKLMSEFYLNDTLGIYRNLTSRILASYCKEQEWRRISGNDANIYVSINNTLCYYENPDTAWFTFYQQIGTLKILDCPQIEIYQIDSDRKQINHNMMDTSEYCSKVDWKTAPMRIGTGFDVALDLKKYGIGHGKWFIKASGKAGNSNELNWTTEQMFEIK
ncbi:MAG: hypothetical protein R3A50_04160 [Saprospiraceae bacterium]